MVQSTKKLSLRRLLDYITMPNFRENFIKLLPVIITSTLTILLVGGGYLIKISQLDAQRKANIDAIKQDLNFIRKDIEKLDQEKVDREVFERVMIELQRMNNKLDDMNDRINANTISK